MPEDIAANVAAAGSDEEFAEALSTAAANEAAGLSDNDDEIVPIEDKTDPTEASDKTDEEPEKVAEGDDLPEDHDPDSTLNEDVPEKSDKKDAPEPKADAPQFVTDAKNLAKKWDTLSDGEKMDKVKNLANSRPHTFKALAKELGTTPELFLSQNDLDASDYAESGEIPEFDLEKVSKEAEEKAYQRFKAEQANEGGESERNRFVAEIANYAKHNKLDAETAKTISDFNGDLFKKFDSIKYDPETGEELSLKGRLKIAITGDEKIQEALINAGAIHRSKRIVAGVAAALPKNGKASETAASDTESVAKSSDDDFSKAMDRATMPGVVKLEI